MAKINKISFLPHFRHGVQSITFQPHCFPIDLIGHYVKAPAVGPVRVANPLIEPVVPAVCIESVHTVIEIKVILFANCHLRYGSLIIPFCL